MFWQLRKLIIFFVVSLIIFFAIKIDSVQILLSIFSAVVLLLAFVFILKTFGTRKYETKEASQPSRSSPPPLIINTSPLIKGVKPGTIKRDLMCHACRRRENIIFECPNCENYYCSDCAPDLHNKCMECNMGLNRINSSTQPIKSRGRYDCYVCKNGVDSGFKCPKCGKNYCLNCGIESEENCLNCSTMLEKLK